MTYKSDDVIGRTRAYEAIVKGERIPKPGLPESFRVLVKELQALGMDLKVLDGEKNVLDLRELDDEIEVRQENIDITPEMLEAQEQIVTEAVETEQALISEAKEEK